MQNVDFLWPCISPEKLFDERKLVNMRVASKLKALWQANVSMSVTRMLFSKRIERNEYDQDITTYNDRAIYQMQRL